jgi:serine protease Do
MISRISRPEWYHELDMQEVFRICSALEREGYLFSATSAHNHPIMGRTFVSLEFDERRAAYGEYEFAARGFERVREHFQHSVLPVVVEKQDGSPDIGTCFLVGNYHNLITARHVVENKKKVEIRGVNGQPLLLRSLRVPSFEALDVTIMVVEQKRYGWIALSKI